MQTPLAGNLDNMENGKIHGRQLAIGVDIGSIVIFIPGNGENDDSAYTIIQKIQKAGAHVFTVEEPESLENFSVLYNIIPFNFMSFHLARKLRI